MVNREEAAVGGVVVVVTGGTAGAAAAAHATALAPILAFVGVILVALMTAYFAKQRQAEQLQAEGERQYAELQMERYRLQKQLDHQRELLDLAELRAVVDEALQNAEVAKNVFLDLQGSATRVPFDGERYAASVDALQVHRRPVLHSAVRITARGQEPLALSMHEFHAALTVPGAGPDRPDRQRVAEAWSRSSKKLVSAHALVINLAKALVSSQLPDSAVDPTPRGAGPS